MERLKKGCSLLLVVIMCLSMFTGCSSSSEDADSGEVIKIGLSADISTFDPCVENTVTVGYATNHIYSGLIYLDEADGNTFKGDLVESWELLDDEVTYTFTLKDGVEFHNGAILTTEDVKFSLERQQESAKVGHLVSMIESITIIDDLTFEIKVSSPTNTLISSLAHSSTAIYNKAYVEEIEGSGESISDYPMGTGQYTFVEWVPGASFTLAKFDNYFDEDRAAQNDGLEFVVITEETARTIALENGEIDILMAVPTTDAERIRESEDLELVEFTSTRFEYFAFNQTVEPFDNLLVRQAFNYAINKDDVLTAMVDGEGVVSNTYFSSAAIGYQEVETEYYYDPDKAIELLEEAGYGDGFSFTCYIAGDTRERAATVIQANLAAIGVTMNVEMMESATFYEKTGLGDHDACLSGWIANAEPDNTYRPLFLSTNAGAGGNLAFYENEVVDNLINEAAYNPDETVIAESQAEILKILDEDAVWVPLNEWSGMVAMDADLQGFTASSISNERFESLHY